MCNGYPSSEVNNADWGPKSVKYGLNAHHFIQNINLNKHKLIYPKIRDIVDKKHLFLEHN